MSHDLPPRPVDPAERRRRVIGIAMCSIVVMLLLLLWRWQEPGPPVEQAAKQFVFGPNFLRGGGWGLGRGPRANDATEARGATEGAPDATQTSNADREGGDSRRGGPVEDAGPSRSIGWLGIFSRRGSEPRRAARPGVGGPDEPASMVGNTNTAAVRPSDESVPDHPDPAHTNSASPTAAPPERGAEPRITPARPAPQAANASPVLADDFSRRLAQAGAKSGDVQISLMWNNANDLDLHCIDPSGEEIFYQRRRSRSGGLLDVDMNAGPPFTTRPVENVYWPQQGAPPGRYRVYVNHYQNHGAPDPTPFVVRILVKGETRQFNGQVSEHRKPLVHEFRLSSGP